MLTEVTVPRICGRCEPDEEGRKGMEGRFGMWKQHPSPSVQTRKVFPPSVPCPQGQGTELCPTQSSSLSPTLLYQRTELEDSGPDVPMVLGMLGSFYINLTV